MALVARGLSRVRALGAVHRLRAAPARNGALQLRSGSTLYRAASTSAKPPDPTPSPVKNGATDAPLNEETGMPVRPDAEAAKAAPVAEATGQTQQKVESTQGTEMGGSNQRSGLVLQDEEENLPPLAFEPGVVGAAQKGVSASMIR